MLLSADATEYLAIAGAAVGVVGAATATAVGLRLRRLRRAYANVARDVEGGDLIPRVARLDAAVTALHAEASALRDEVSGARADLSDAIRHVAVVRYDAFEDMGGRLSFSAALLDDSGDGLVFTSIHARSETRAYAKGIKGTTCAQPLSPEEQQAIAYAYRSAPTAPRGK